MGASVVPLVFCLLLALQTLQAQEKVYRIILKTGASPGYIDSNEIRKLKEPYKALLSLYSAMGGTNCDGENCELTSALGLGKQGSEMHKALIHKYFASDKLAQVVLAQDCYLRPSGASTFSDYEYLLLSVIKDTIKVHYKLIYYDHGKISHIQGPDIYILKNDRFRMISRPLLWRNDANATGRTKSRRFRQDQPFQIISAGRAITDQSSAKDTSACHGWTISKKILQKLIVNSKNIGGTEWDLSFSVLPCIVKGQLIQHGNIYRLEVNGGSWMYISSPDTTLILGDYKREDAKYFIARPNPD
jgi:hypothetical protein